MNIETCLKVNVLGEWDIETATRKMAEIYPKLKLST
jgi:hypothetical protein